ncbi:hypothetical protein LEP1GSC127_5076 [Leptospira kirschneri str. 200801925]|nr:hypothetical protein LEP1GSC127_5076 [Leptospira kirschneri str. 200801925]
MGRFEKIGEISVLVMGFGFNQETIANKTEIDPIKIETLTFPNKHRARQTIKIPIPFSEKLK